MMSTTRRTPDAKDVAVIGGGAAGMMAAIAASEAGAAVVLIEKNGRLGKKLRITGKGRCNLTNDCDREAFLANIPTNPRFLYGALAGFSNADTKQFFEEQGVPLKTERGNRVFPVSDRAEDIVAAMEKKCRRCGVEIRNATVAELLSENGRVTGVRTSDGAVLSAKAVIVATGGVSYPLTGSTGDGYRFARAAGLTVTEILPSLVPLTSHGPLCGSMQGLSLRNVGVKIVRRENGKVVYEDFGELMFTHFGVTGPTVLSASAHLSDIRQGVYEMRIDLKPALDEKKLDARVLSDFGKYRNRDFANALCDLLPQKMIPAFVRMCGVAGDKKINAVTREERERVVETLKCFRVPLDGFRPIEEAIVTRGGVSVRELSPKTMEAKSVRGLYFAGEVIDVDAYTGGFNLQIAFSTGYAAGKSAAKQIRDEEERISDETDSDCD